MSTFEIQGTSRYEEDLIREIEAWGVATLLKKFFQ